MTMMKSTTTSCRCAVQLLWLYRIAFPDRVRRVSLVHQYVSRFCGVSRRYPRILNAIHILWCLTLYFVLARMYCTTCDS